MRILGLTGGMGAGKTYVAGLLKRAGWPVFDADATVHAIQGRGGAAIEPIRVLWPETIRDDAVDRDALRRTVIGHPDRMRALERIIHPLVRRARARFLRRCRAHGVRWCVLDIPLLFETGGDRECDAVAVVTAPSRTRVRRVMARRSISADQARALIARQMPDAERLRRADFVIRTGLSRAETFRQTRLMRLALEGFR